MKLIRQLRSALVVSLLWAAAWFPVGLVLGVIKGWVSVLPEGGFDVLFLAVWTALGACAGALFSGLLITLERNRSLSDLSWRRLAIWGVLGGAALPLLGSIAVTTFLRGVTLSSDAPAVFGVMAVLGAVCAIGTLALARRAERGATMTGDPGGKR